MSFPYELKEESVLLRRETDRVVDGKGSQITKIYDSELTLYDTDARVCVLNSRYFLLQLLTLNWLNLQSKP